MAIALRNGAVILAGGLAATDCACCDGGSGSGSDGSFDDCGGGQVVLGLTGMTVIFEGKEFVLPGTLGYEELGPDYTDYWTMTPNPSGFSYVFTYTRALAAPAGATSIYREVEINLDNDFWQAVFVSQCAEYDSGLQVAQTTMYSVGEFLCYEATFDCVTNGNFYYREVGSPIPLGSPVNVEDYDSQTPDGLDPCTPTRATISIVETCVV